MSIVSIECICVSVAPPPFSLSVFSFSPMPISLRSCRSYYFPLYCALPCYYFSVPVLYVFLLDGLVPALVLAVSVVVIVAEALVV